MCIGECFELVNIRSGMVFGVKFRECWYGLEITGVHWVELLKLRVVVSECIGHHLNNRLCVSMTCVCDC